MSKDPPPASHRRLPPLKGLRVLEALHQTGSVTGAAARLNVSHSAVSHQIRILEEWSAVPLFIRDGRTTRLSEAGRHLAATVRSGFDAIRHEVDRLPLQRYRPVRLAGLPVVIGELVLPHIERFLAERPEIRLHVALLLSDRPTDAPPDISVVFVRRAAMLGSDQVLLPGDAYPACTPAVLERFGGDVDRVLREGPLIYDEDLRMWPEWWRRSGLTRDAAAGGDVRLTLEGSGLIFAAVREGRGVGFVRSALHEDLIARGALVLCSRTPIDLDWAYVIRVAPGRANDEAVQLVVAWLAELVRAK